MLRVAGQVSYHRLILDPLSRVMFSSDGDDFEFREQCLKEGKLSMKRSGYWPVKIR